MTRRRIGFVVLFAICTGLLAGCGGGNRSAFTNGVTATLPEVTRSEPATPATVTEQAPASPAPNSTTTAGASPAGAAAAAGAAVAASTQDESTDTTEWGWIAFAILAAVVLAGGLVWWLRGRHDHATPDDGTAAPPASS